MFFAKENSRFFVNINSASLFLFLSTCSLFFFVFFSPLAFFFWLRLTKGTDLLHWCPRLTGQLFPGGGLFCCSVERACPCGLELYRNSTVAASAPVAERSVKLKRLVTHRFHKAQVYCVNCYSDPVW